jgi:hypothetical protein
MLKPDLANSSRHTVSDCCEPAASSVGFVFDSVLISILGSSAAFSGVVNVCATAGTSIFWKSRDALAADSKPCPEQVPPVPEVVQLVTHFLQVLLYSLQVHPSKHIE